MTRTIVAKWGNSLALRVPSGVARSLGLRDQTPVIIDVVDGALIIRAATNRKKFDLSVLLADITPANVHAETSTGPSVGNELI